MASERGQGPHPDLVGIEPWDEDAIEERVRPRRFKRRIKATASLVDREEHRKGMPVRDNLLE